MTEDEILTNLCTRDPRNPDHKDIYAYLEDDKDEIPPVPRVGCYCDSCFKGCDRFAVELLRYRWMLKETVAALEYIIIDHETRGVENGITAKARYAIDKTKESPSA